MAAVLGETVKPKDARVAQISCITGGLSPFRSVKPSPQCWNFWRNCAFGNLGGRAADSCLRPGLPRSEGAPGGRRAGVRAPPLGPLVDDNLVEIFRIKCNRNAYAARDFLR